MSARSLRPLTLAALLLSCIARAVDPAQINSTNATTTNTTTPISAAAGRKGLLSDPSQPAIGVRALVMGVSDFQRLPSAEDLPLSVKDAAWFAGNLRTLTNPTQVDAHIDQAAGHQSVRRSLQEVLQIAGPQEAVFLYFNTRGVMMQGRAYLLTADSVPGETLPYTSLPVAEIGDAVARSSAGQIFLLADTTHGSGAADQPVEDAVARALGGVAARRADVYVVSSSKRHELEAPCEGHGLFTCAMVGALLGGADLNQDRFVEMAELAVMLPAIISRQGGPEVRVASYGQLQRPLGLAVGEPNGEEPNGGPALLPGSAPFPALSWAPPPARVEVCLSANGRAVPSDHVFYTGDLFSMSLTVPESGHLYVLNIGPDGAPNTLYPLLRGPEAGQDNRVLGGTTIQVMPPEHRDPIVLVDPVGPEKIFALWSSSPLATEAEALAMAARRSREEVATAAWGGMASGTKGLTHLSRVDNVGRDHCSQLTPEGDAEAWVVELTVDHR